MGFSRNGDTDDHQCSSAGHVHSAESKQMSTCYVDECDRMAYAKQACQKHYMQEYRQDKAKRSLLDKYWEDQLLTAMIHLSGNKQDVTEFIVEHYKEYLGEGYAETA